REAVAAGGQARGGDAVAADERVAHRRGTPLRELLVVVGATDAVGVALDGEAGFRARLHQRRHLLQHRLGFLEQHRAAGVEVDPVQLHVAGLAGELRGHVAATATATATAAAGARAAARARDPRAGGPVDA